MSLLIRYVATLFGIGISFKLNLGAIASGISLGLPQFHYPTRENIFTVFFIVALPQLSLSISNAVIAREQTIKDLFGDRGISIRRIGLTYSLANLIVPFFRGIPVCHGCGGLARHYTLGARTGGSVILYGSMYVVIGLFFSQVFAQIVQVFPQPILGIILLFEALTLLLFVRDQAESKPNLTISLLVGMIAFSVPQGYILRLIIGTGLYYLSIPMRLLRDEKVREH